MNKKTLGYIKLAVYAFDFFIGLHLMIAFWGDYFFNDAATLLPAVVVTAGLVALNMFVFKLDRKVKAQAELAV